MQRRTIARWQFVHTWSSLVCTLVMLLACVTGLPLIFHAEIEGAAHRATFEALSDASRGSDADAVSLASIVARAQALHPGEVVQLVFFDQHYPVVSVATAPSSTTPFEQAHVQAFTRQTGEPIAPPAVTSGFLYWMEEAHIRLFMGLGGTLVLGVFGLLFLAALISGVVLYAPFMRKLGFGTIRTAGNRRASWLDVHNLFGIATAAWLLVVGATGVLNTLDTPIAGYWQATELADMTRAYRNEPPPRKLVPLDQAVAAARIRSPGMQPYSIAYPGNPFASPHHYGVFMVGTGDLNRYLLRPTLIDAATGRLTAIREMPLLVRSLFVSRPLHFGDYAGLPLKLIWAALDLAAIVVLVSGLYLWLARRKRPANSEEQP